MSNYFKVYYMLISWMPSLTKGAKRRPMNIYKVYVLLNFQNAFDGLTLCNNPSRKPQRLSDG
jgi:hypothetical protein